MVVFEMEGKAARRLGQYQHGAGAVGVCAVGDQRVVGSESDVGS